MKDVLANKLLTRELTSSASRPRSYRNLYSDRQLIADLDIVNELDGHSGCVNALSWSKSGQLLASGSDDQHLNIHSYQPSTTTNQFQLTTTVATGHTANIFSVKFMPHRNDRTVVTAAGDGEVRIFDLEYSGQAREASAASGMAAASRRRGRNAVYNGVRYLNDGDTDCRVYRSHGNRVKRIVTESSPHLFLTCSEDGEVRQWDLRQPSSAYPAPRDGRYGGGGSDSSVPPPLISYKRYNLDLNTISCSPSQPHYIALGGAHLHAFLHDRRMTGRDKLREAGKSLAPSASRTADEDELMSQATQCVRKFAPKGQQRMKRTENGHITACKISDARPDEMVVSWSGDHIYSFDLVRSPDAAEQERAGGSLKQGSGSRTKQSRDRKRKRKATGSDEGAALRVRYHNGQSEDIAISQRLRHAQAGVGAQGLTAKAQQAQRIARSTVKIRSAIFGAPEEGKDSAHQSTTALGEAAAIISDIDETMRTWRYPLEPTPEMVVTEQTLRRHRESARRFVQGAGTLARVLGGKLQTGSLGPSPLLGHFASVEARSNDLPLTRKEHFGYDFLKATILWLDSGLGQLIEGFTRPADMSPGVKAANRLPILESEAGSEAVDELLIPYLLRLADDTPVVNVETNRFEVDANRQVFPSEKAAVLAFAAAVRIPFADLSGESAVAFSHPDTDAGESASESVQAQDRQTALRFWGGKVARGVLLNAAEGVNFVFVDRAFGGLGRVMRDVPAEEYQGDEEGGEVLYDDEDGDDEAMNDELGELPFDDDDDDDDDAIDDDNDDDNDENDTSPPHEDDDSSDPDEIDGVPNIGFPRALFTSAFERRRHRERVEAAAPCYPFTRVYRGHCNVRTVKDVNYFGPNDEHVVSGSDDGNFFIWDRRTSELVNVLEGDGEVVNVVQGHPYEPLLAVSGIDHTVKIFSPDGRARAAARLGQGARASDASSFSSIAWPQRRGGRRSAPAVPDTQPAVPAEPRQANPLLWAEAGEIDAEAVEEESFVAPNGLTSRRRMHDAYRIMNNNDVERQGGSQDASYVTVRDLHPLLLLLARSGGGGLLG